MKRESRRGEEDVLRLLGLARRAGAVVPGTEAVRQAVRRGQARLVVMAGDASGVQLNKIRSALRHRPIPWAILGDRAALGGVVGHDPVSALAVTTASFAAEIQRKVDAVTAAEPLEGEESR